MDVWLREHPPVVEWKMNWPANTPDADEITAATCAAHERSALGTRFEGPAVVTGFAAVEDASWLTKGGTPAISYGPGDLRVAHADDEYVLIDEVMCAARTYAAARDGLVRSRLREAELCRSSTATSRSTWSSSAVCARGSAR